MQLSGNVGPSIQSLAYNMEMWSVLRGHFAALSMWSRLNKVIDFGKDCNVLLFSTTMFYFHLKWGCTSCLKDASHKCCFEVVIFRIFVIYCTSTCIFIQLEVKQINKQTLLEPTSTYKSNVKSTVIDIWKRCVKKYCSCDKACQFQLYRVHLDGVA